MTNLTSANLYSEAWNNIYAVINNRSNIPDPSDAGGYRKFVYSRQPQIKSANFKGFPYIIVNQPNVSQDSQTVSSAKKTVSHTIQIEIHSSDENNDGSVNGSGQIQMNVISDNFFKTFGSTSVKAALRALSVENISIEQVDTDLVIISDHLVWARKINLTFRTRIDF